MDFEAEPYDLAAEMPKFGWPTVVISGGRDLITPRAVAEEIVSLIPDSVLVDLATAGHSAIDFREGAALDIVEAVYDGDISRLPDRAEGIGCGAGKIGYPAAGGGDRCCRSRRIRIARCDSACGAAGDFVTGSCGAEVAIRQNGADTDFRRQWEPIVPLRDFIVSPGFVGAAAVVAALIVLCAVLYAVRRAGKRLNQELEQRERHHQEARDAEQQRPGAPQQCWQTFTWLVDTAGVEPAASEGATLGLGPELAMATLRGLLRDAERLEDETLADAVAAYQNQFALVLAQQGGPLSELAARAPSAMGTRNLPPQATATEAPAKAAENKPDKQPAPDDIRRQQPK